MTWQLVAAFERINCLKTFECYWYDLAISRRSKMKDLLQISIVLGQSSSLIATYLLTDSAYFIML